MVAVSKKMTPIIKGSLILFPCLWCLLIIICKEQKTISHFLVSFPWLVYLFPFFIYPSFLDSSVPNTLFFFLSLMFGSILTRLTVFQQPRGPFSHLGRQPLMASYTHNDGIQLHFPHARWVSEETQNCRWLTTTFFPQSLPISLLLFFIIMELMFNLEDS